MFELHNLKGNTFYYKAFTNVGVYRLNNNEAVLIDSCDHPRMAKGLSRQLDSMGLKVTAIINTHCHVDHIFGNRFLQDKYGCRLLSTALEQGYIRKPDMEHEFYDAGLSVKTLANPFYSVEPSETEIITPENLPEGLEIFSLPGHSIEMIGVRTSDGVVFLADSILSEETWENYKLPFFRNVNKSISTLRKVREMKAEIFVPSHTEPLKDIAALADYNIEKLLEKKQKLLSICDGRGFEDIFVLMMEEEGLSLKTQKYSMYAVMVKNLLQSLIEDGLIYSELELNRMKYHIK